MNDTHTQTPETDNDLYKIATNEQKRKLRKQKVLHEDIKAILYGGCKDVQASMQFHQDLRIFGLWEALLYVQGYEVKPYCWYTPGTAHKAFEAAVNLHRCNND